jgi:mRNA interferase MazF
MVDKVTTVRGSRLGARTGRATFAQMVEVECALLVFLGIAG